MTQAWNKGKSMPHTAEWESHRLSAIRATAKKKIYQHGYHRPPKVIEAMRQGLKKWRDEHPDEVRRLAIDHLPKNVQGERNGNWRGGRTKESRSFAKSHVSELSRWRQHVLERDHFRCKNCGTTQALEAHHIIPLRQSKALAFLRMNGVTLCHVCHQNADPHRFRNTPTQIGKLSVVILTIPHRWQEYDTVGNWGWSNETLVILVSDTGDWRANMGIAYHELFEALACKHAGVTQQAVDQFDLAWKAHDGLKEPGDDPNAPYFAQHQMALATEQCLISTLGLGQAEYQKLLSRFNDSPHV